MTALLERTLGETIELRFEMRPDIAPCMVDRAQLENAILNLVINARDAMHSGGLITIETSNVTLDARDAKYPEATEGDYVLIAVRDTGIGMSAQVRARVFEPFFTTKDVGAGSGLGLSMVYGFVKQSGGHVSIESEEGSGTEVRLYIPQTNLPLDPIENIGIGRSAQRAERVRARGRRRPRTPQSDRLVPQEQNYQVAAAPDGSEALAILDESGPFDLLLSDIILPGDSRAQDLAKESHPQTAFDQVLAHVGLRVRRLRGKSRPPDYANLLQKPFSMGALARKMRSVLKAEEGADPDPD